MKTHEVTATEVPLVIGRGRVGGWLASVLRLVEYGAAVLLAVDVGVVFLSVICRYFLHHPLHWAEEVARALMVALVFLGAATVLGRDQHAGLQAARGLFPRGWRASLEQLCWWIMVAVSAALFLSGCALLIDSEGQTTPIGLPQGIFLYPLVVGSAFLTLFAIAKALAGPPRTVWATFAGAVLVSLAVWGWNGLVPDAELSPRLLLVVGFFGSLVIGVPIAFALAFASLLFFLADPSVPMLVYSQQVLSGADHFVLL